MHSEAIRKIIEENQETRPRNIQATRVELVPLEERMDKLLAALFQQAEATPSGAIASAVCPVSDSGRGLGDSGELI